MNSIYKGFFLKFIKPYKFMGYLISIRENFKNISYNVYNVFYWLQDRTPKFYL